MMDEYSTLESLAPWLFARTAGGVRWGLERTRELLAGVGDPHRHFRSIHIAGTNGKGSVAALTASALQRAAGRAGPVGLYTSPHLVSFSERIRIDGIPADDELVLAAARRLRPAIEATGATFFEATTAIAFLAFAEAGVVTAVVEVGLGGRLDATNVIDPVACAITNIALEHTDYLGTTLEAIAREKAGILKPRVPALIGEPAPARHPRADSGSEPAPRGSAGSSIARGGAAGGGSGGATDQGADSATGGGPDSSVGRVADSGADGEGAADRLSALHVLRREAHAIGAPIVELDQAAVIELREIGTDGTLLHLDSRAWGAHDLRIGLIGAHQARNAAMAAELLALLPDDMRPGWDDVRQGFAAVRWPGRLQVERIRGTTWVFDVAHNPAGVATLAAALDRLDLPRPHVLLFGALSDKDARSMILPLLGRVDAAVLTSPDSAPADRRWNPSAAAADLAAHPELPRPRVIPDFHHALQRVSTLAPHGTIIVTGSFHTVGEALSLLGLPV